MMVTASGPGFVVRFSSVSTGYSTKRCPRVLSGARITMPKAVVRLSAGRQELPDAIQALCFLAGANSIFYGEKLLTTGNPEAAKDEALFARLGLKRMEPDTAPD